jgi:hypothetical protein
MLLYRSSAALATSGFVFHSSKVLNASVLLVNFLRRSRRYADFTFQTKIFSELVQRGYPLTSRSLNDHDLDGAEGGRDSTGARRPSGMLSCVQQNLREIVIIKTT